MTTQPSAGPDAAMQRAAALWPEARAVAVRRCSRNLYRLAHGEGGFYDDDDLLQDLFLEFHAVLQQLEPALASTPTPDLSSEPLATAWRKALWGGGLRILRRAPQRLWRRAEVSVAPHWLDGDAPHLDDAERRAWTALHLAGSPGEDGHAAQDALARLARIEAALSQLRPAQRQAFYLTAVLDLPAGQAAAQLGLPSANALRRRVHDARTRLAAETRAAETQVDE